MLKLKFLLSVILLASALSSLNAKESKAHEENAKQEATSDEEDFKEKFSVTQSSVKIGGRAVDYTATAGNLILKDDDGKAKASIFFVAYTRNGVKDYSARPITFVTNGGPGSSAVWLHLGLFGPRRLLINDDGTAFPPYNLVNNEYSLLDSTDLVFIDPVSAGFSRPAPGEDAKQFHGIDEDVKSLAEFIRLYITRYHRWDSPKFFAGESYGTTRAAALAAQLHDDEHIYLNGVILISTVLSFQSIDFDKGNDLPYVIFLPSYAATAWYHHALPDDLQKKALPDFLKEVEEFALNEYSVALMKGDKLAKSEKDAIAARLARYTGLSPTYIRRADLRINLPRFSKELLRNQNRTVGRFDSRYLGIDSDNIGEMAENDPSADAIFGAFTATWNNYVDTELGWHSDKKYEIIANVWPWSFGKFSNSYVNVSDNLRDVMTRNPRLKVFVASGYYDLATPYFGADYTFNHLGLDPSLKSNLTIREYVGGHMMYTSKPSLIKLKEDLNSFIKNAS